MPSDPKKRQKKLERRSAKRKEKRHLQVREQTSGLPERLTAATRFPVLHCWIGKTLMNQDLGGGLGWVVLSRAFPNGLVAVATFLVDRFCLGVKNVHAEVLTRADYDNKYLGKAKEMELEPANPADARKLLADAVEYAHSIGLAPHPDYAKAVLLFGPISAADSTMTFEFGKDGKPFFISGPNETPERCRQIMAILANTCGQGKFDFMMRVDPNSDDLPI